MTSQLLVTSEDIARAMGVCATSYRCFVSVTRPMLPFDHIQGPRGRPLRVFNVTDVLAFINQSAPYRATPDFETKLLAAGARNSQKLGAENV